MSNLNMLFDLSKNNVLSCLVKLKSISLLNLTVAARRFISCSTSDVRQRSSFYTEQVGVSCVLNMAAAHFLRTANTFI